ncbi:E3 SUMO-protein ligase ZBED1-like [Hydra vulgaris]|uniref:E3 SUMO-protein ligase ZBED1-like n=1 Tax=Hydra vulgaris TaxID=6087 RepID=A0ABM4CRD2_HYDVU
MFLKRKIDEINSTSSQNSGKTKTETIRESFEHRITAWPTESSEYQVRQDSVIEMIVNTSYPMVLLDQPSFRKMIKTLDPKFKLPGSATLNKRINERFLRQSAQLKDLINHTRKVTICLDGWTKKGLTASFLGVSACFYDTTIDKTRHAFLNLMELQHPHTGEMLAECLKKFLDQWGIRENQVMLIVSDNGSNMVKAIRLLQEVHAAKKSDESESYEFESDESEHETDEEEIQSQSEQTDLFLPDHIPYRRMPCMAHTLQLLIKPVYEHYSATILETRQVVSRIRKSSVAIEKLIDKCGKSVITDCTSRWNSTYPMIDRLLKKKTSVNEVLTEIGIYTFKAGEWVRLQNISSLLEPFAVQTDILQTDAQSLSQVLPSILNLECHLQEYPTNKSLTANHLGDLRQRFQSILQPDSDTFNPLPSVACLLDPTVAVFILTPEMDTLLHAAKMYIIKVCGVEQELQAAAESNGSECEFAAIKRFKFLSNKIFTKEGKIYNQDNITVASQLSRYLVDISGDEALPSNGLLFWKQNKSKYSKIAILAEDLLSTPASQAFVERIFSLCGILTVGRRNRMKKSLDMRVFMKLNKNL